MNLRKAILIIAGIAGSGVVAHVIAQPGGNRSENLTEAAYLERATAMSERIEARGLAEPFRGITVDGEIQAGLYKLSSTGIDTAAVREAATEFLNSLSSEQRNRTHYPIDDAEWRKWANQHSYVRQGVSFGELNESQTSAAVAMLRASLSAEGLQLSQDIMKLNTTLGELNDNNFIEYGEDKYHLTVMGVPSAESPWGWQLDGHHLALNYFVLGDQIVMAPAFWGSEPAVATSGRHAGTRILAGEQAMALEFVNSLTPQQRTSAVVDSNKTSNNARAQAFSDNIQIEYSGLSAAELTAGQKQQLRALIRLWIYKVSEPHAAIQMTEIERYLDNTFFSWVGETASDAVFYYRIHSPVILIEFDHQTPVGLSHLYERGRPYREHIHAVVRLPNGNDYGKDLLRQHYASAH